MVWILPQAQAEVGHPWSDADATCVGGNVNLPNHSGPDSAHSKGYGHGHLWRLSGIDCKISTKLQHLETVIGKDDLQELYILYVHFYSYKLHAKMRRSYRITSAI